MQSEVTEVTDGKMGDCTGACVCVRLRVERCGWPMASSGGTDKGNAHGNMLNFVYFLQGSNEMVVRDSCKAHGINVTR